jgi:hypothetical protein
MTRLDDARSEAPNNLTSCACGPNCPCGAGCAGGAGCGCGL